MTPRRWRSAGPARPPLFLEIDDRLGALQPRIWTEIALIKQQQRPRLEQPRHQYLLVRFWDGVVSELEARDE
jgi:hypothetical protein